MNDKIDLRIIKTHTKLTTALSEMMNEMHFDDITVFDLCERANVRRATFYKHFKDKYDFLKSVATKTVNHLDISITPPNNTVLSAGDYLSKFVSVVIDYFENNPTILSNMLGSNTFPTMFNIITTCTHKALVDRLNDANRRGANITTDIDFTANFINGGIANILLEWLKEPSVEKEVLLTRIKEILVNFFE